MAKSTTSQSSYRDIITSIKRGNFAPLYILMGDEPYYIDKIVEALEETVVPKEDRDFNAYSFYGADADLSQVVATARQFPMMSDRQLVVLKEAQSLMQAKTQLEKLEHYFLNPNSKTVFVVSYKGDTLNATSRLLKAAAKSEAVVFKSNKVRDYQIADPIRDYCTSKGVSIDDKAISMLAEFVGTSLSNLFGEIDKLILSSATGSKRISPDDIERNIGVSKEFNNFELVTALASRNYVKAMQIVDYFSNNPRKNPTTVTNATIFGFFTKLLIVSYLKDKSDSSIMSALQAKTVYAIKEVKTGLTKYSIPQQIKAIDAIREFDAKSKGIGSFQKEHDLLRELIFKIFSA